MILLEGRTEDGLHIRVEGTSAYDALVWINGARQDVLQRRIAPDGGSWSLTTPAGTISDPRLRMPRTEQRLVTFDGEPVELA